MRRLRVAAVTVGAVAAVLSSVAGAQEMGGRRHRVTIEGFRFAPARVLVAPGDTVVWINRDLVPHTLTAQDESWDSREVAANATWEMRITEATASAYFCRYHPRMQGRVVVAGEADRARGQVDGRVERRQSGR